MDRIVKLVLTSKVYDIARETPLDLAVNLSKRLNNKILLKREDLQDVFSFKIRGAYNKIAQLSSEEKKHGVIAASAGNHAQGVALSAKKLKLKATIVMPKTTPDIKINAVKSHGAEVVLYGDNYTEASKYCKILEKQTKMTYIPPFDDELVIAGNGTIAYEIIRQTSGDIDAVFVPIGGGGLIAGIASFMKNIYPKIKIIGVQPKDSNAMYLSFKAGKKIILDKVGIFADGVAVKEVGDITLKNVLKYVDDIILVDTDEICSSIKDIYYDTRNIVEPAGALGIAGIKKYVKDNNIHNQTLVAINSGANMNFDRMVFVSDRAVIGEKREALYAIEIPEKPGALKTFCMNVIKNRNISEFSYRLTQRKNAYIFVGINMDYELENKKFMDAAQSQNYTIIDLTNNELAKNHMRYMIGGKSPIAKNELLYHFSFPEKIGALSNFLSHMKQNWNISLFHYRKHGGEYGRVLMGFEIPPNEREEFQVFLDNLKYNYTKETNNIAYKLFL